MKLLVVVGARPNFMKVAPILKAVRQFNASRGQWAGAVQTVLVHTGQHYDARMSDAFFADLDLPNPDVFLGAGSGSHAAQTAEVMRRFEPVLLRELPQVLVVVGDVNSTLACAVVASKLPAKTRPLVAHVEAGLRSFDRSMPEEINRLLTDQISDFLFVTEKSAIRNLMAEGIPASRIYFVGNTMIDSLYEYTTKADASHVLGQYALKPRSYALLTLHRPGNVDAKENFSEILAGLTELAQSCRVIFPAHPRTGLKIEELGLASHFCPPGAPSGIQIIAPQSYINFLCLMKNARIVVTDSGGIQEETTALGIPCVTLRDNTERPVTIDFGTNALATTRASVIRKTIQKQLALRNAGKIPELWDGRAAARIVGILAERLMTSLPTAALASAGVAQIQPNAR